MRSDNIGSHYQNSDNFLMYVGLKFPNLVVCLNDFLRLDEEGLACCRLIVDNAFHCPLVHWCDWYNQSSVTDRRSAVFVEHSVLLIA